MSFGKKRADLRGARPGILAARPVKRSGGARTRYRGAPAPTRRGEMRATRGSRCFGTASASMTWVLGTVFPPIASLHGLDSMTPPAPRHDAAANADPSLGALSKCDLPEGRYPSGSLNAVKLLPSRLRSPERTFSTPTRIKPAQSLRIRRDIPSILADYFIARSSSY